MHTWPLLRNFPVTATLAAASGSASGRTMDGACPPGARLSRLTWSAAARMSCLPTSVEPVKLILRTAGFSRNSSAISWAEPMTRLATPAGRPASIRHSNTWMRHSGVWLAGLQMMVQLAASAGAILRDWSVIGKFHGLMAPSVRPLSAAHHWPLMYRRVSYFVAGAAAVAVVMESVLGMAGSSNVILPTASRATAPFRALPSPSLGSRRNGGSFFSTDYP